jgi:hypothetical protein
VLNALETVAVYYDAWQSRHGNLNDAPLADEFEFTGPVASFDSAEGYRAMAREAGQAVTSFNVPRQFVDGNAVCSIIDWELDGEGSVLVAVKSSNRQTRGHVGATGVERAEPPRKSDLLGNATRRFSVHSGLRDLAGK